jgi:hypothetical protein
VIIVIRVYFFTEEMPGDVSKDENNYSKKSEFLEDCCEGNTPAVRDYFQKFPERLNMVPFPKKFVVFSY